MKNFKNGIIVLALIMLMLLTYYGCSENDNLKQLKQNIETRLIERADLIKDLSCELTTTRTSDSPRGEMTSTMKFQFYKKFPDKIKTDFIEGNMNGEKITKESFENFKGRRNPDERGGRGRGMRGLSPLNEQPFDLGKYLSEIKLIGTEKIYNTETHKIQIKIKDKQHRFKEVTLWLDKATWDVVKFEGELRKDERIESGIVTEIYQPLGPNAAWVLTERNSETFMIFNTPQGEFELSSLSKSNFENYKFNQNLGDEIFSEKQ